MKFTLASTALAIATAAVSADNDYDAIIVGAGAAGCPLAQTLAEAGLKTLLIERGGESPPESNSQADFANVLRTECVESFSSGGVVVSTGNCMGGATSVNQGIYIEETSGWFEGNFPSTFFSEGLISDAYTWVRERVAPEPAKQVTTNAQLYTADLIAAMDLQVGIDEAVPLERAGVPEYGIWAAHSSFKNEEGRPRFSADQLLDRDNVNLEILTNAEVDKVEFTTKNGKRKASCVSFTADNMDDACIKPGGRIYLSAGAFHTPELLMKSGIKEGGDIFDNDQVGKNLSDKPGTFALTFFQDDFAYDQVNLAETCANKLYTSDVGSGQERRTLLFEDSAVGVNVLNLALYEKSFVPRAERDSFYADFFIKTSDCCTALQAFQSNPTGVSPPFEQCAGIVDFEAQDFSACIDLNGLLEDVLPCFSNLSFLFAAVSDPESTGSVMIGDDGLIIDVNYLTDPMDLEAFGEAGRTAYSIKASMDPTSASAPQTASDTCPNAYQAFSDVVLANAFDEAFQPAPIDNPFANLVSTVQPNLLEFLIGPGSTNAELGSVISQSSIISPHHFAGTARVGSVINEELKVQGVNNLYVADASALPKTPRVNTMATTMMLGRLAGVAYVNERNA